MASERINTCKDESFVLFRALDSVESIEVFLRSLSQVSLFESGVELPKILLDEIRSFIYSYQGTYKRLTKVNHRQDYRDAFKHHRQVIHNIVETTLDVVSASSQLVSGYSEIKSKVIITIEGQEPMILNVRPRSFRKLYGITRQLLTIPESANQFLVCAKIAMTIASLYTDFRLDDHESDLQMEKDLATLSGEAKINSTDNFKKNLSDTSSNEFKIIETVTLLRQYTQSGKPLRSLPYWSREFVFAMRKLQKLDFNLLKLKESTHSTGTRTIEKVPKTIPGILASVFEKNNYNSNIVIKEFDTITNFNINYRVDDYEYLTKVKSKERNSVCIEQKKPKMRLIHTLSNSSHDRLTIFESYDKVILQNLKSDCTFDQADGPSYIKRIMDNFPLNSIYSMDLTDATNTMLLVAQKEVKRQILMTLYGEEEAQHLVDAWEFLMRQETSIKFNNGKVQKYTLASGQPMGYTDSFASFAVTHHIIVLTMMRLNPDSYLGSDYYRLLGDDIVLSAEDQYSLIPDKYISLVNSVNVECNKNKGYLYNPHDSNSSKCIAEFAKYLIIRGQDMTPIPLKLLICKTEQDLLGLLCWLQQHSPVKGKSSDYLIDFLSTQLNYTKYNSDYLRILFMYPIDNILHRSFKSIKVPSSYIFDENDMIFLINYVKDSMSLSLINMYADNRVYTGNIQDTFKLRGLGSIRKDIFNLYDQGKLSNTKLGKLLNSLELIQISNSISLDKLFADTFSCKIEDLELYIAPIIKVIESSDMLNSLLSILDVISNNIVISDLNEIRQICETCIKLSSIHESFHDRSWSSYPKRISSMTVDKSLQALVKTIDGNIHSHTHSVVELIDNLIRKQITNKDYLPEGMYENYMAPLKEAFTVSTVNTDFIDEEFDSIFGEFI